MTLSIDTDGDEIAFAPDDETEEVPTADVPRPPWRVLVVDDDEQVHRVTRLSLRRVGFRERPVEIVSAFSAKEAESILARDRDFALAILDVVMETDDAGLRLIRHIRERLANHSLRIVVRTGQPGQAPEERVIVDYDINDYISKTELTAGGLFTTVISSLRAYSDIVSLESGHRGLEALIRDSDIPLEGTDAVTLGRRLLQVAATLANHPVDGAVALRRGNSPPVTLAATGRHAEAGPEWLNDPTCALRIAEAWATRQSLFGPTWLALHLDCGPGAQAVAWIETGRLLTETDRKLFFILADKTEAAFANVALYDKLKEAAAELKRANEELEARVAARTFELAEANAKLLKLANLDSLTGVLNRRAFLEIARMERDRAQRYGHPLAILLLDLDRFKSINDTFGHHGGDTALKQVVVRANEVLRATDRLARFGGEEFVVLLPETDSEGAVQAGERLRTTIGTPPMEIEGQPHRVTVSIGVAVWREGEETLESLISRADAALYAAKRGGRDRVVLSDG